VEIGHIEKLETVPLHQKRREHTLQTKVLEFLVAHHPGSTLSFTQAEALVQAAERRLGRRPHRRTALLRQRIEALAPQMAALEKRLNKQRQALEGAVEQLAAAREQEAQS